MQDENDVLTNVEDGSALGRHAILLASLILLLVALPLLSIFTGSPIRFPVLLSAVLASASLVMRRPPALAMIGLVVAVGSTIALLFAENEGMRSILLVSLVLDLILLGAATLFLLTGLLRAERVSTDTLVGGACVYLLLGVCFTIVFLAVLAFDPGAFQLGGAPLLDPTDPSQVPLTQATRLLYFSFVTLTTLGYGDLTPAAETAQMLAAAEAVIGQLYLAIFIARLVGLYAGQKRKGPTD